MYVIVYGLLSLIILGLFYFAIDLFVGADVRIIKEAFYRRRITLKVECVPCIKLREPFITFMMRLFIPLNINKKLTTHCC